MKTKAPSSGSTIANSTTLCPCSLRRRRVHKPVRPPGLRPGALPPTAQSSTRVCLDLMAIAVRSLLSSDLDVRRQLRQVVADDGDERRDLALQQHEDCGKR